MRAKRKEHGLTIEHLSERAGITPNYLGRIEQEKVDPSLSVVIAIARALRVRVGALVDDTSSGEPPRAKTHAEAIELAKALEALPLDVRETLVPALWAVTKRIRPRTSGRRRRRK